MFALAKASAAVLALASFAQATITIAQPNIKGNSTNTISWTSSDANTDPETFSIELINQIFNSQFALANNVQTTQGSISFELPVVPPGAGYTIEFVNVGNINDIFATSGAFSVQENDATTTTGSTASSSGSSVSTPSASSVSSAASSASLTTPVASSTASSTGSSSSSGSSSSTSAPAAATTLSGNGAIGLVPAGSFAALIAGVIAVFF